MVLRTAVADGLQGQVLACLVREDKEAAPRVAHVRLFLIGLALQVILLCRAQGPPGERPGR